MLIHRYLLQRIKIIDFASTCFKCKQILHTAVLSAVFCVFFYKSVTVSDQRAHPHTSSLYTSRGNERVE